MKKILLTLLMFSFLTGLRAQESVNGIKSYAEHSIVTLTNGIVKFDFDIDKGTYSVKDLIGGTEGLYNAYSMVNEYSTTGGEAITWEIIPVSNPLGDGAALKIRAETEGSPTPVFLYSLYPGQEYVIMHGGIFNNTPEPIQVGLIQPVAGGRIFRGLDISENFRAIDGEGGGVASYIRTEPDLTSANNLIVHFGNNDNHHTLVAGGISYSEFAKYARIGEPSKREEQLQAESPSGLTLLHYNDLGAGITPPAGRETIIAVNTETYNFEMAAGYPEAKTIVYSPGEVLLELKGLDRKKQYTAAVVWCDDSRNRIQSIYVVNGGKREEIIGATALPSLAKSEQPQIVYIPIPARLTNAAIAIKSEKGANAVASEAILFEGVLSDGKYGVATDVVPPKTEFKNPLLNIYAEDIIGKRVDPCNEYIADKDGFYLAFSTRNPVLAAEKYAFALRDMQGIRLNHYYFPTICMWYAMEPKYGGNVLNGINDSPGAVAEMQRVKDSGWLKYETMAIRLVPDCYEDNNQNGWWDDEHWQMHGSGKQDPQMELKAGHYREPYETTKKWADAVTELGGKPFTYFQTAVRSDDYAEAFPEHMLFNQSWYELPRKEWSNRGFSTYDFTDPGFCSHMQDVYRNLHNGGIQGMMFDYPYTGWPIYGGMEDKYSTAAASYRNIFKLSREGLGKDAYIHERNLKYGSEIALGLVSSQRTWGDTDVITAEMVLRSGLRWYKNRVVVNYDMDAKNLLKAGEDDNEDGLNKLLTMSYVTASRFLLANSFAALEPFHIDKLSRIFPYPSHAKSARPLDAFVSDYPRVYGLRIDDRWQELTFFNEDNESEKEISIALAGVVGRGGAGMHTEKRYYVYDFWNDRLAAVLNGSELLTQKLRKGEARQLAVREVENNPQVLSTDRHIMQGLEELREVRWDAENKTLSGIAVAVVGEPMNIVVAKNGYTPLSAQSLTADAAVAEQEDDMLRLTLTSPVGGNVRWSVNFK